MIKVAAIRQHGRRCPTRRWSAAMTTSASAASCPQDLDGGQQLAQSGGREAQGMITLRRSRRRPCTPAERQGPDHEAGLRP